MPAVGVSGKRRLADSAENMEFQILRLNHITCGMFIVPRDVSDKIDGGEESHGTSDTEYFSPPAKKYACVNITLPEIDI